LAPWNQHHVDAVRPPAATQATPEPWTDGVPKIERDLHSGSHSMQAATCQPIVEGLAPDAADATARISSPFVTPTSSQPTAPGSQTRIYRDEDGKIIPAHLLDRRTVDRKVSNLPRLSEIAVEHFSVRAVKVGQENRDIQTARNRLKIFLELIGDHPVDTYTGADLQAYIALMTHWSALERHRPPHLSAWEILARNADLKFKPLKRSVFEHGYVSIAKTVIGSQTTTHN
jgi:hypothetical protein